MNRIYAVGDLHGYADQFDRSLELIEADGGQDACIVFLGDYCDRGPNSRGVLQQLIDGQAQGRNWITLKGNHDRMFEWFMETPPRHDPHMLVGYHWFHENIGGRETLGSYGVRVDDPVRMKDVHAQATRAVPQSHIEFLRNLPTSFETDDLFFCHAGVRPGVALNEQTEEDLVWIRQEFHDHTAPFDKLIVHGHTPVRRATHYGNRVNLDSGAGYGDPVSVAVFEGRDVFQLTGMGREDLAPFGQAA
jgi:serine/threonine protein phosphatase 1